MPLPNWEVDLIIFGPITVQGIIHLQEPKGYCLSDPFKSDIRIRSISSGIQITATAYASNIESARKVTLAFVGYMLDTLTLTLNIPLFLSFAPANSRRSENFNERRIISENELHNAFREARLLSLSEPTFLRALGWYRKGLYTEDILDSFLAYWNSIEIVAGKYHPDNDESKKGSKSQVWECFKKIWGGCNQWPVIPGQADWIDNNYESRISIAHGTQPITIDSFENIIHKIPVLRDVAFSFLSDWRNSELNPRVTPELQAQYGYQ